MLVGGHVNTVVTALDWCVVIHVLGICKNLYNYEIYDAYCLKQRNKRMVRY